MSTLDTEYYKLDIDNNIDFNCNSEDQIYKLQVKVAHKFINLCIERGFTIFGEYVREYLCDRPYNFNLYKINISSWGDLCSFSFDDLVSILQENGFETKVTAVYSSGKNKCQVYECDLLLINAEFLLGRKIRIHYIYAEDPDHEPTFGVLDFGCNAWLWNQNGIHISRNTGTDIDALSDRDIKHRESLILSDCINKIATSYPIYGIITNHENLLIQHRQFKFKQFISLLLEGWKSRDLYQIKLDNNTEATSCIVCKRDIERLCIKLTCCDCRYHYRCFKNDFMCKIEEKNANCIKCKTKFNF
jgi:hypothetical protein